jgi:hypothetical protein
MKNKKSKLKYSFKIANRYPVSQVDVSTNTMPLALVKNHSLFQHLAQEDSTDSDESDAEEQSTGECDSESETESAARENQDYDEEVPYHQVEFSPSWQLKSDLIKSKGLGKMCKEGDNTTILASDRDHPVNSID